jgi:hypothetical protein
LGLIPSYTLKIGSHSSLHPQDRISHSSLHPEEISALAGSRKLKGSRWRKELFRWWRFPRKLTMTILHRLQVELLRRFFPLLHTYLHDCLPAHSSSLHSSCSNCSTDLFFACSFHSLEIGN